MNRLTLIALLFVSFTCRSQQNFEWLIGKWKLDGKPVYEVWTRADDGVTFHGSSFKVNGADTTILEKISFKKIEGNFYYIPDVPENMAPVKFKLTKFDANSFVAENPQHDFPKTIKYTIVRKANGESLEASIEGNGKVIPYRFDKVE